MRLSLLGMRNFRCFSEEVVEFDNYTALVGQNNCGKASVLRAIGVLYESSGTKFTLEEGDIFVHAGEEPLELTYNIQSRCSRNLVAGPATP